MTTILIQISPIIFSKYKASSSKKDSGQKNYKMKEAENFKNSIQKEKMTNKILKKHKRRSNKINCSKDW